MRFLSNKEDNNHNSSIKNLIQISDKVIIVTPFFSESLRELIMLNDNLKEVEIVTNLNRYSDTPQKIMILYEMMNSEIESRITIKNDKSLHGKVYAFYKGDSNIGTIVTSANYTEHGLIHNNEYGIIIDDKEMQKTIINTILTQPYEEITYEKLRVLYFEAKEFHEHQKKPPQKLFDIHDYIEEDILDPQKNHKLKKKSLEERLSFGLPEKNRSLYYKTKQILDEFFLKEIKTVYVQKNYDYHVYKLKGIGKYTNIVAISANSNGMYLNLDIDIEPNMIKKGEVEKTYGKSFWGKVKFIISNEKQIENAKKYVDRAYHERLVQNGME